MKPPGHAVIHDNCGKMYRGCLCHSITENAGTVLLTVTACKINHIVTMVKLRSLQSSLMDSQTVRILINRGSRTDVMPEMQNAQPQWADLNASIHEFLIHTVTVVSKSGAQSNSGFKIWRQWPKHGSVVCIAAVAHSTT